MSAVLLRVRQWGRANGRRAAYLAVLIGVLAGSVLSVAGGARRTASAPDRYTATQGGDPDLIIYQPSGAPLTDEIGAIPGVAEVYGAHFVMARPVTDNSAAVLDALTFVGDIRALGIRVIEGRDTKLSSPDEFTVNRAMADALNAKIGDQFDIAAFDQQQTDDPTFDGSGTPGIPPFKATLVGINSTPSEFEDPTPLIMYSPGMLTAHPDMGIAATVMPVQLLPGTDANQVLAAARRLPNGEGLQRPTDTRFVSSDVRRAVQFVSTSLWIVAGVAAVSAALVVALLITRLVGPKSDERLTLRAIGWRNQEFVVESLLEAGAIAGGATVIASAVVIATSGLFPFGAARVVEANPGINVDLVVLVLGGVTIFSVCMLSAFVSGTVLARPHTMIGGSRLARQIVRPFWSLPTVAGIRFALDAPPRRRSALTSLAPGVIGCAGCVAAMTVGLSLTRVVGEPARWGFDTDYVFGNQYLPQENDIVAPALGDPAVTDLAAATLGTVSIDGTEVNVLAFETVRGSIDPETLEGRAPSAVDEIGLGREVARELGKRLGDAVQVTGPSGAQQQMTVVGFVMTPYDAGGGAAMTYDGYRSVVADATKNLLLVRFADGTGSDAASALAAATGTVLSLSAQTAPLPSSIRSLERAESMPYLVAAILFLLGTAAMMQMLAGSVGDRRRDFGIMRALGAVGRQLRGVLHWQATTVAAVALTLGIPIGLLIGRLVFGVVADRVGVLADPSIAWSLFPVLLGIVVLLTNVAALVPGRRAAYSSAFDLGAER